MCCFADGVLTVYYDPGFVPNFPNDLKPFKSGTRQDGEGTHIQCQIAGEGESDNPTYFSAFITEDNGGLDCCWTSNHNSVIPNHLNGMVEVFDDETMYLN